LGFVISFLPAIEFGFFLIGLIAFGLASRWNYFLLKKKSPFEFHFQEMKKKSLAFGS